jgi:ABC-type uncharacterized transport system permease subunit
VYDLSDKAILFGFLMQLAWLTIAVMLSRVLWVKGIRHYSAVGG